MKAPPDRIDERELARALEECEAERCAELTGRRVNQAAIDMYRMRWSLDDITLSVAEFRGPHERNGDTELAWVVLTEETEKILQLAH